MATTMVREPEARLDDERTIFVPDYRVLDRPLEDEDVAQFERDRYDEQILVGLVTF